MNLIHKIQENTATPLTMAMIVYNEEDYIGEAIESLLTQTFKNFILFISDNASTDGTSAICEKYAKKDKRIFYVRQDKNLGQFYNLKYILDRISAPFAMYCGGHDKWVPDFAEELFPFLKTIIWFWPILKLKKLKLTVRWGK